jgi:hypothetical protein
MIVKANSFLDGLLKEVDLFICSALRHLALPVDYRSYLRKSRLPYVRGKFKFIIHLLRVLRLMKLGKRRLSFTSKHNK